MRTAPMFVSLDVCKTSRIALADQLGKTYIGICQSFQETLWTNTRVGRRHAFCHVPDRLTSRACVFADLLAGPALLKETPAARTH